MTRLLPLPLLLAGLLLGCSDPVLVVPTGLAQGQGGTATNTAPDLDIVVRMHDDATDFNPWDLMRVFVNGVDRTQEMDIGGLFALLRLEDAPQGTYFVELARRVEPVFDTFTWNQAPLPRPTLSSVEPTSAQVGTQVTIRGTLLDGGALRVFFGGEEGTVATSTATEIVATVPADALPGLVWVLVGDDAAEGLVDFQPLDTSDVPVPAPEGIHLAALFPASNAREGAVLLYGLNFTNVALPYLDDRKWSRVFGIDTVTLPVVGDVLSAWVVVDPGSALGEGLLRLRENSVDSNELPLTVLE
jgi:hypothetical protein